MIQQLPSLTDTHCHLNSPKFETDFPEVLRRAKQAGIVRILIPGMDIASSQTAVQLAESHEHLYAAVGVHPHYANAWTNDQLAKLRELARSNKVVAIGEIGLDYHRDYVSPEDQMRAYREQLDLAIEVELPVVLHNRESVDHILDEIRTRAGKFPEARTGVLHSFAGSMQQSRQAIELDLYLGIGGPVTYRNTESISDIVRSVTTHRMLLETDAPYLPPQPHRGERNEPAYVRFVAEKMSSILEMTNPDLIARMYQNSDQLFGWANGS